MKNKKHLIIAISIVIIAILYGTYIVITSYLFNEDYIISNGHDELIEIIKSTGDDEERKLSINKALEFNLITQEEANELY